MRFEDELTFAASLADLADSITSAAFERGQIAVEHKADATEVTNVDRECERALVQRILSERPAHSVFGEEHGHQGTDDATFTWMIDPIDGTSGFVRGLPVWGTLLALLHGDDVVVAMVSAPVLGRRWWATRSGGAFADGRPCQVSTIDALSDAQVSVTVNAGWHDLGLTGALNGIQLDARRSRGFGDFWQHVLVAEGSLDVAIDAVGVAPYDLAGVRLVVEEAGGVFTDRLGVPSHDLGTAVSSNGLLHPEIIERLRG
ncbi:MAG: histidinol phosphatase [Actinomycetota bacterium]|nr:histidinol phosphatase [Actinomycetota bacterium]